MVYLGPSRGCQTCKDRRIKCDQTRPQCLQCRKSKRSCSGCPEEIDLVFRDETLATRRRTELAKLEPSTASSGALVMSGLSSRHGSHPSVPNYLPPPVEQQAITLFVSNYVQLPQGDHSPYGDLDCLVRLVASDDPNSHLSKSVNAISLAFLSNVCRRPPLMAKAGAEYSQALALTNAAIRDPAEAKTDRTLLTVLLLAMFVIIACPHSLLEGSTADDYHIDGVAALLKLRGKTQLENPIGLKLWEMARGSMILSFLARTKPIEVSPEFLDDLPVSNPVEDRLVRRIIQIPNLRVAAHNIGRGPMDENTPGKVRELLQRVIDLDESALDWSKTVPSSWASTKIGHVSCPPNDRPDTWDFYPGDVYVYSDMWIANTWNLYRWSRLVLQIFVIRLATWLQLLVPLDSGPEFQRRAEVTKNLVNDICASVPYSLGYARRLDGKARALKDEESSPLNAIGGYTTLAPLAMATVIDGVPPEQRLWLRGRLAYIGREKGISRGTLLANLHPT